ncbi:MAG: hypothetical protein KJ630_21255 [Proteobacteria bacterium]|nr:hypothetical protein [Pseudomonadota bacterium]
MKSKAYKFETSESKAYRGDAGSILIVVYIGVIIFFFMLGTLSTSQQTDITDIPLTASGDTQDRSLGKDLLGIRNYLSSLYEM